jgi:hypothetical protein
MLDHACSLDAYNRQQALQEARRYSAFLIHLFKDHQFFSPVKFYS